MIRRTERTSRKHRRCDCGKAIAPGSRYWELVASPDHDGLGNLGWWRMAECWDCAMRRGNAA